MWSFEQRQLLYTFSIDAPVNQITLNRDNSLLAASADDDFFVAIVAELCAAEG